MKNGKQISYALCGAIAFWLCSSINAEEVATHSLSASEKILLMETINVTSNKEIAKEDMKSDDPEVDQILNLVDSVTLSSDDLNEESDADSVESIKPEPISEINEKVQDTDELNSTQTKPKQVDVVQPLKKESPLKK